MTRKYTLGILGTILLLLIVIPTTIALEAESYQADYTIVEKKVIVSLTIRFPSATSEFSLNIPADAAAIEVHDAPFTLQNFKTYQKIVVNDQPFQTIRISYITHAFIENNKDTYFIVDASEINAQETEITVRLPEGATLKYDINSPQRSIIPSPQSLTTDGKSIIITWNDLSKGDALLIIYNEPHDFSWYMITGIALVMLLGIALVLRFWWKYASENKRAEKSSEEIIKKESVSTTNKNIEHSHERPGRAKETEDFQEELTRNLFEEERAIVETLWQAPEHELWQKQLVLRTGISKVKLSRKLRNLEAKGIIEKVPYGNTNKIRISKK